MLRAILLLVFLSQTCGAGSARASERAAAMLERAIQHMQSADFPEALSLLKRARRQTDTTAAEGATLAARIELQTGVIHAILGQRPEAQRAFEAALRLDPTVELDSKKASIAELFQRIRGTLSGEIEVTSDLPDVDLWLDGRTAGAAPYRGRLSAGRHELRATLDGQQLDRRQVVVYNGRLTRVALELRARIGELDVHTQPAGAQVLLDGREVGTTPLVLTVAAGPHQLELRHRGIARRARIEVVAGRRTPVAARLEGEQIVVGGNAGDGAGKTGGRLWTWVALAGAASALAVSIGFYVAAASDHADYEALPSNDPMSPQRAAALADSGKRKLTISNVMFGIGGALAVTSVVLYFVEGRAPKPESRVSLAPALGAINGLQARVRF